MPRRWVGVVGRGSVPIAFVGVDSALLSGSTSLSIGIDADTEEGDLLLLFNSTTAPIVASGWTVAEQTSLWNSRITEVHYRWATGSEPSSETFTFTTPSKGGGAIVVYRNVDPTNPINNSSEATGLSGTPVIPSLTTSVVRARLVAAMGGDVDSQSWTVPGSMTELWDQGASGGDAASSVGADEVFEDPGATGTRTFTASPSSSAWGGLMVALTPEFP